MYSFIEGKIVDLNPTAVVINCNGIGYNINISLNTFSRLSGKETVRVHTHLVVREDALVLFGFAEESERVVFQQLISVSGIGPNTARLILSALSPEEVIDAIVNEKVKVLQAVKGIGGKSAQRLIVDLKDKMHKDAPALEILAGSHNTVKLEALSALVMLGFSKAPAEKAIEQVFKTEGLTLPVEQVVKYALKIL